MSVSCTYAVCLLWCYFEVCLIPLLILMSNALGSKKKLNNSLRLNASKNTQISNTQITGFNPLWDWEQLATSFGRICKFYQHISSCIVIRFCPVPTLCTFGERKNTLLNPSPIVQCTCKPRQLKQIMQLLCQFDITLLFYLCWWYLMSVWCKFAFYTFVLTCNASHLDHDLRPSFCDFIKLFGNFDTCVAPVDPPYIQSYKLRIEKLNNETCDL